MSLFEKFKKFYSNAVGYLMLQKCQLFLVWTIYTRVFLLAPYIFLSALLHFLKYLNYPWEFWVILESGCSISKSVSGIENSKDKKFIIEYFFGNNFFNFQNNKSRIHKMCSGRYVLETFWTNNPKIIFKRDQIVFSKNNGVQGENCWRCMKKHPLKQLFIPIKQNRWIPSNTTRKRSIRCCWKMDHKERIYYFFPMFNPQVSIFGMSGLVLQLNLFIFMYLRWVYI